MPKLSLLMRYNFVYLQRAVVRRNRNPDVHEVGCSIRSISQRKIIKKIKGGNTTYGTENAWTTVCHEPMPKKAKH